MQLVLRLVFCLTSFFMAQGYRAQSSLVLDSLDALMGACASRGESLVIEGVLLSTDNILALMSRHQNIIPFLIHISNEAKHRERFAVRCALAPCHLCMLLIQG